MASTVTVPAAAAPRYICFLCKRKFASAALLTRHKQLSELHRRNLAKQDEENQTRKEEFRQAVSAARKQMQDLDSQMSKQVGLPTEEQQTQRANLELKFTQAQSDYGGVQEKLEVSRHQQMTEKAQGGAGSSQPAWHLAGAHETTIGRLLVSAGAASWQGNKDVQEDRFLTDVELLAPGGERVIGFIVFDGHSGSLCVDAMMDWLPRNMQKCLSAKPALTEEHMRQAVIEACVLTDDEFLRKARERDLLDGSTMITCLMWPDDSRKGLDGSTTKGQCKILIANLGDSRAVLCRSQNGSLSAVPLSDDQKPCREDERKRIEDVGGVVDMQGVWRVFTPGPCTFGGRHVLWGLAVSRAFGDLLMKEPQKYGCVGVTGNLVSAMPEIHIYDLHPNEDRFLVIACDGIWDVLSNEEAISVCVEHRSADAAAHALIRKSFEVGSDDNLTALVVAWQINTDEAPSKGSEKTARLD
ncbi:unnamed protein product [Polarella glacialis]|uniref:PPM-type phosphatase domain-containing protein n=1 Tax=Polarella glacialis TaxID=89957 RepID=A0A813JJ03_POLGL|nr:unnamed protein product [Polarella glacialis]|mmetsp:Transcript_64545/g.104410  ORF Transcript_64545/g.104410 Transcript_64545/m.104410 type:complete len:469 (-) Transcript_64545:92-1498(-)